MRQKIENTPTFKAMEPHAQRIAIKRVNRVTIEENIGQARNLGLTQWRLQTPLCNKWQKIVEEVINEEQC